MRNVVIMAFGAAVLYQVAKRYGITSFEDVKNTMKKFVDDLNIREWVNVDNLKEMVAPERKPDLATA